MHHCGYCDSFFEEKEQRLQHRLLCHPEKKGKEGFCMFCIRSTSSLFQSYFNFLDHLEETVEWNCEVENHAEEKGRLIEHGARDGNIKTILKMCTVAYRGIGNSEISMDKMIELVKKESMRVVKCERDDGIEMYKLNETNEEIIEENDVILIGDMGRMNESPRPMIMENEELREEKIENEGGELVVSSPTVGYLDSDDMERENEEDRELEQLLKDETLYEEIDWDSIQETKPSMPDEDLNKHNADNGIEDNNETDVNERKLLITKPKFEEVFNLYHDVEDEDESKASNRKRDHVKDSSSVVKKPRGLSTRNPNILHSSASTDSVSSMPHLERELNDPEKIEPPLHHMPVSVIANHQQHPSMQQLQPVPPLSLPQPQSSMGQLQSTSGMQPCLPSPSSYSPFVPMNMGNQWGSSGQFMGQSHSPSLPSPIQSNGLMLSPSLSPNGMMSSPGTGIYQNAPGSQLVHPNSLSPQGMGLHSQMNPGVMGFPRYSQFNISYPPLLAEERGISNDSVFLNGYGSDICPQCSIAVSINDRIPHYICRHFGIYYSQYRLDLPPMERWLSIELGSEEHHTMRVCPHCVHPVFTIGRIGLLNHLKESHFDKFLKLGREYKNTHFANTQCSDVSVHNLLMLAYSLHHQLQFHSSH